MSNTSYAAVLAVPMLQLNMHQFVKLVDVNFIDTESSAGVSAVCYVI